ncbi:glycoside hydrolase family 97 protein [Leeuwenhoekiella marinoflava]|uniref:glycoside hydrolase family 97 protein n=1 Tax=Leeuwenhoekiella marinoflava TaxID=988 RepID=UPI0030035BC0
MNTRFFLWGFILAWSFLFGSCDDRETNGTSLILKSPGAVNSIHFDLTDGLPSYGVYHLKTEVLKPSKLGFVFSHQDTLQGDFKVLNSEITSVDDTWEQVWGAKHSIHNTYKQLLVELQETTSKKRKLNIEFRAYDDGIAFRYIFPKQEADSIQIMDELTTFELKDDGKAWWIPAYDEQRYENLFTASNVSTLDTVHTPLTIESNSGLALSFHEANLTDFASITLAHTSGTTLKTDLVPWSDGVKVKASQTFTTPWRTLQISEKATNLITSNLILNLNEPNALADTSFIKTFKYIGIWWGMHIGKYSFWEGPMQGATTVHAKEYIDYANQLGIDHLLIEGWNKGWTPSWYENKMHTFSFVDDADNFDLKEVTDYSNNHGVEIIGYHETGSNLENYLKQVDSAFALYKARGIHTVKIGHVGSKLNMKEWHQGQFGVNYFRYILKKAAEYDIQIYFHEPIKDTGERRTYPNMMAREAARGQEYNAWSEGNPPNYTTILPFTRMLAGPMDFTPAIFDVEVSEGYPGKRVHSTRAKQLALMVVIYSPIQMLADLPENYVNQPSFQFLRDIPTDWEDTHILDGEIGNYIVTVRKDINSSDWYLGSITNEEARDLTINLDFLEDGATYEAQIYADSADTDVTHNPNAVTITSAQVTFGDTLRLKMGASGGAAIRFKQISSNE